MTMAVAYWILMLLWLVLGFVFTWPNYKLGGVSLLLFVALVLLGWRTFGAPIKG